MSADKKATAIKKRLAPVKEKADKISVILFTKKNVGDTNEYVNTLKAVSSSIEKYDKLKAKEKTFPADDGAKIEQLMKEYEQIVMPLTTDDKRFARFFGGSRVRRRLDQVNAELHTEIYKILTTSPAYIAKKEKEDKKKKKPSKKDGLLPSMYIQDEEGRALWENSFNQTLIIEWERFVDVLKKKIGVDEEAEELLRYVLDNANTGTVSIYKFGDFLTGLGPLQQCVAKAKAVFNSNWFHGFLTSPEAERILDRQQHGTFLIRFSKSKSGSFAMAYVDGNLRNVVHTLIECHPKTGYQILETFNKNAQGRNFASLQQVVDFYNGILIHPVQTELTKLNFFHGDLTSQEAEDILSSQPEGSYLFRFSSKVPTLAISYVENNRVNHGTIECLSGGYRFENDTHIYRSLNDIVTSLAEVLRNPIEVSTCDYRATAKHKRRGTITAYKPKEMPSIQPAQEEEVPMPQPALYAPINPVTGAKPPVQPTQPVTPASPLGQRPGSTTITPVRAHSSTMIAQPQPTPAPSAGGDGNYGQMPTPTQMMNAQPVRIVSTAPTPVAHQPAPDGNYGQMPTPSQLAGLGTRPGMAPSLMPMTSPSAQPADSGNYGQMPTPTQLAGSSALKGTLAHSPSQGEGTYGQMPTSPHARSATMSASLAPRLGPSIMSQSVTPKAPVANSEAESNYGQMPTPGQLSGSNSGSVLGHSHSGGTLGPSSGTPSSPANAYASFSTMQIMGIDRPVAPVAPPKPSQSFMMPSSPPQKRDEGNYGQMPTPAALHSQGSQIFKVAAPVQAQPQPQPVDEGNYGQMPTPSALFAQKKPLAIPPSNLAEEESDGRGYHSMPETVKAQFLGNGGVGAPRKSVVVMNSNGTGYEEREMGAKPSLASSGSDTYGRMPAPGQRPVSTMPQSSLAPAKLASPTSPLQHNKSLPGTPTKPVTDHYGSIPSPTSSLSPKPASALAHSVSNPSLTASPPLAQSPSSGSMYGSMPAPQKSTSSSALAPPKSALARSNEPLNRTVSTPVLSSSGGSDTYGSMPMPQNRGVTSPSATYGSIAPPVNKRQSVRD